MEKKKDQSKGNTRDNNYDQQDGRASIAPDPMNGSLAHTPPEENKKANASKKGGLADDDNADNDGEKESKE